MAKVYICPKCGKEVTVVRTSLYEFDNLLAPPQEGEDEPTLCENGELVKLADLYYRCSDCDFMTLDIKSFLIGKK